MERNTGGIEPQVDEYLWPLNGSVAPIDWAALVEELRIRQRLTEIMAHVRQTHLRPRLARLGERVFPALTRGITEGIIAGPENGPPWAQTLREPVPRALREEWDQLTTRLQALRSHASAGRRRNR
jgi:hypothetical protein